ncbi:YqcC family protein [Catenovulum adriaticum]|uniref:YqcC family protein n=1 Tax=Catenovulum adriaticum TaxID=2984846 RepID=A0ABY7AHL4_9ALTE|nr:YqcC family protein [Catenovulum sp. TS8]WAJ69103.1 YqcC family protein [Catenovulum sp. TS8]
MNKAQQLSVLLRDLEQVLKQLDLWQVNRPSQSALTSTQPFCIDTLDFHQWLQFIFIERMQAILNSKQSLPPNLCLMPIAEEVYKDADFNPKPLYLVLTQIDNLFN